MTITDKLSEPYLPLMSLSKCLKKAGKAISGRDAKAMMQRRDQLVAKGMSEAEADLTAVREIETGIQAEMQDILKQAGVKQPDQEAGITIMVDDKPIDSNAYIADIDNELDGIDAITTCLTK